MKNQDEVSVGLLLVHGVVFIVYWYYTVDYIYKPSVTASFLGGRDGAGSQFAIYGNPVTILAGNPQPAPRVRVRKGLVKSYPDPYPNIPYP